MRRVTDEGQSEGDGGGGMWCGARGEEEETDELIETETEGQLLGFETYAWQRERTGRAGDGWEGQHGVTGGGREDDNGWTGARDGGGREDGEGGRGAITARG